MTGRRARLARFGMWGMVVVGLPGLFVALLGAGRVVPVGIGVGGGAFFLLCLLLGALIGFTGQQRDRGRRDVEGRGAMIVMLAAHLKGEDDTVLEGIVAKGGPAAEAAALLLEQRRALASDPRPQ